ncbi:TPA: hypothetical protein ACHG1G_004974, partial [Escherichia coli]
QLSKSSIYSTKPAGLRRKMRKAAMDRNYLASVLAESGLS